MGIENLKEKLVPVSGNLKELHSHDSNDHYLVQEICFEPEEYAGATHVLIGCPQDEGVRRNNGRTGAAKAPDKIREQFYKMQHPDTSEVKIFDAGNVVITDFTAGADSDVAVDEALVLEYAHEHLHQVVLQFLKDGKKVIVLGGGNDISYADVRALAEVEENISAINIDAHLDMRIAEQMTSGTPYRKLIEDGFLSPQNFYEFGIRRVSNAAFYLEDAEKMGVNIYNFHQLLEEGVIDSFQQILNKIDNSIFFLGLDMDSIQASDAPGVSASSPIGFKGQEILQLIHHAKQKENLRIFEITETNPRYDIDGRTSKLAAGLVYGFLFG
ncbi:MAG: formimidoylglutamase [Balneolaceae bacterium]